MSVRHAWYIACSRCGGNPAQISTESIVDARAIARSEGYVWIGREDVCPHCAGRPGGMDSFGRWDESWPSAGSTGGES